jgi:hypothetical protein
MGTRLCDSGSIRSGQDLQLGLPNTETLPETLERGSSASRWIRLVRVE